ncbi:MAG: RcnB family protein, partial [Pseudomonadota bacterium]
LTSAQARANRESRARAERRADNRRNRADNRGFNNRNNRQNVRNAQRQGYRAGVRNERRRDRVGDRRVRRNAYRAGRRDGYRKGYRKGNFRRWDRRAWRANKRFGWRGFRRANRGLFRIGPYYAPFRGHYYQPVRIGFFLDSLFFQPRFFINDPFAFRLPPVYGPYRWVRYYDDVLLVDIYTGEVVDVIENFFW